MRLQGMQGLHPAVLWLGYGDNPAQARIAVAGQSVPEYVATGCTSPTDEQKGPTDFPRAPERRRNQTTRVP